MIVVSDSTPLITLMKATKLEVLHGLFGEIVIPEAVFRELTSNENYPDEAELIRGCSFIRVVSVTDKKTVSVLQRATGLDLGESEAIVYADDVGADLLLMDEIPGRRVATEMGLNIMGSVGVLVLAFKEGCLSKADVESAFQKILAANRHISSKLIDDALEIVRQMNIE